jgi:CheY-like chemotaxis protein
MSGREVTAPNVLIVEDSMIIALDTEECLLGLGAGRVVVQATVAGALSAIADDSFDFAVLDVNLGNESSEQVANELKRRGIPFWLATGYNEMAEQLEALGARGLLVKPFGKQELAQIMNEFAAAGES